MKITFCCFTCLVGEDHEKDPEESRLIDNQQSVDEIRPEPKLNEPKHSLTESENSLTDRAQSIESQNSEKIRRAAGISRKYNIKPHGLSLGDSEDDTSLSVKIAIKIMPRSGMAKIFAIDSFNVFNAISSEIHSTEGAEERPVVQLRTKIQPMDIRGHSKKYEVVESITGSLKFTNECMHTISLHDFQSSFLRLRLYHVLKHQKDNLLGEYILNNAELNLDFGGSTTNVSLTLHSPSAKDVKPPLVSNVRHSISSSASSTQSQSKPEFKSTIRRGDTKVTSRKPMPNFDASSDNNEDVVSPSGVSEGPKRVKKKKGFLKTIRQSASENSQESGTEELTPKKEKVDKMTALEWLKKGGLERTEKVSELQDATEELQHKAGNFSAVSVKLREKYEKKHKKKQTAHDTT